MFNQITILAPGLLGASVARAVSARGLAKRVIIWARRPEVRVQLDELSWCHATAETPEEAVAESDLVIIAAPVDCIVRLTQQIAPHLAANAIVTDVGSVKGEISRLGHVALNGKAHFVGSHPMAGSEKTGWANGDPELFTKRTCFVTPLPDTNPGAVETAVRFWHDLGSEVVTMSPDAHDEIVAHISHLPHVLAATLCAYLQRKDHSWRNYAGGGLRDTTRIAASDAKLWRTILEQNRDEVLRAISEFQDELQSLHSALSNRDYHEVATRLERGSNYRSGFRP
ncbi:MAG: prephenate dehydrogenase [Opitutaceae bacterium]|nr:prephenate dehydrogenase [Opitutaceae bacterium]